jgi:hypothetical protein
LDEFCLRWWSNALSSSDFSGAKSKSERETTMKKIVEIRSLNLKAGARGEFHRRYLEKIFPLLQKWKMDVVTFGPSLHDENSYYVVRAFESLEDRQTREDAYYGSTDWREGPREEILALIENYVDVVIEMEEKTVNALREKP